MLLNLHNHKLILASGSPRRRELMAMLDLPFTIGRVPDCEEVYPAGLAPRDIPAYLSRLKAGACRAVMAPRELWITADTIVISPDGEVMGKPRDGADAERMLRALSGREHEVVTGVTLTTTERQTTFSALTAVEFAAIPADEIRAYVERYRPFDKAGAYGIQEWIGAVGIRSIRGSFYNVMGLPVHRLWDALKGFPLG